MNKHFHFRSPKTLAFAAIFFGFAGAINLLAPVDLVITALSNKFRMHDASGEIVVVGLDDYATKQGISSPISATQAAIIFEALLDAGARKIVFAEPVVADSPMETARLTHLLDAHPDRLFIVKQVQGRRSNTSPANLEYLSSIITVHNDKYIWYWGGPQDIAYAIDDNGQHIVAVESVLTGVYGDLDNHFFIDYAIDVDTIPFADFSLDKMSLHGTIAGKDLIIGYEKPGNALTARALGRSDLYGQSTMAALGAETLKQGVPRRLGWWWSLGLAICISWLLLGAQSLRLQMAILFTAITGAFIIVTVLSDFRITMAVGHSICMILTVTPFGVSRVLKEKAARENAIHPDSGLSSVNALRLKNNDPRPLLVANIARFDEIMGLLSPTDRRALTALISSLTTPDGEIWHGENGRFYWFVRPEQYEKLDDHLVSLALILRNGFSVGSLPVSLDTVFGIDHRMDACLSDRILGANLSANRAAEAGKSWASYEEGDKEEAAWSVTRLREFDLAIQAGQIRAYLQPKVDLVTGGIVGAEALARWTHPIRGPIQPDEFVAAAEDGGRIKELTIAIMHCALSSAQSAIEMAPDFQLAINISPSLLTDRTLCGSISSILAQYHVSPANLILELTENTGFEDEEIAIECMHDLVGMGITLSIDDYGTGSSTLDHIRRIPARELKIDRKFVSGICESEEDRMLVKSTIKLAHELDMSVVAEGVEDSRTMDQLQKMGCDVVQGFLIAHPLSPEHFAQFIANLRGSSAKVNAM